MRLEKIKIINVERIDDKKECPECGGIGTMSAPSRLDPTGNFQAGILTEQMVCPKCNGTRLARKEEK